MEIEGYKISKTHSAIAARKPSHILTEVLTDITRLQADPGAKDNDLQHGHTESALTRLSKNAAELEELSCPREV